MKHRYRNVKTDEVINTTNRVGGKKWVPVEESPIMPPEDGFEETPVVEEKVATELIEAPAEKPAGKSARRGKK